MSEPAARVAVIVAVTLAVVFETAAVALTSGAGSIGQAVSCAVYAVVQVLAGAAVVWSLHTPGTVEAHVSHLLTKLDFDDTNNAHRRVLAVLSYLDSDRSP